MESIQYLVFKSWLSNTHVGRLWQGLSVWFLTQNVTSWCSGFPIPPRTNLVLFFFFVFLVSNINIIFFFHNVFQSNSLLVLSKIIGVLKCWNLESRRQQWQLHVEGSYECKALRSIFAKDIPDFKKCQLLLFIVAQPDGFCLPLVNSKMLY